MRRPPAPTTATSLGLPPRIRACLFDLDGLLTQTARVHAAAWKKMCDYFLKDQAAEPDRVSDYDAYVDGKSRTAGTRSFLHSRSFDLPTCDVADRSEAKTINGLGNAKNAILVRRIRHDGVHAYPGSVRYLLAVSSAGLRTTEVPSSANCPEVLGAGIAILFDNHGTDVVVDGVVQLLEQT